MNLFVCHEEGGRYDDGLTRRELLPALRHAPIIGLRVGQLRIVFDRIMLARQWFPLRLNWHGRHVYRLSSFWERRCG
jgi:hypothetical protein